MSGDKIQVTKIQKLVSKRHKYQNLSDRELQTSEKRHKNVNLGDEKLQHSAKKSHKCSFK